MYQLRKLCGWRRLVVGVSAFFFYSSPSGTVDGAEIPRPTTVWMYKTLLNWLAGFLPSTVLPLWGLVFFWKVSIIHVDALFFLCICGSIGWKNPTEDGGWQTRNQQYKRNRVKQLNRKT